MATSDFLRTASVTPRRGDSGRVPAVSRELDVDAELRAMQTIGAVLAGLDEEARQCILAWAGARFQPPHAARAVRA